MQRGILPEGEHVRRAVHWISERRREQPGLNPLALVSEAALRFDLSPLEEEWLLRASSRAPVNSTSEPMPRE